MFKHAAFKLNHIACKGVSSGLYRQIKGDNHMDICNNITGIKKISITTEPGAETSIPRCFKTPSTRYCAINTAEVIIRLIKASLTTVLLAKKSSNIVLNNTGWLFSTCWLSRANRAINKGPINAPNKGIRLIIVLKIPSTIQCKGFSRKILKLDLIHSILDYNSTVLLINNIRVFQMCKPRLYHTYAIRKNCIILLN